MIRFKRKYVIFLLVVLTLLKFITDLTTNNQIREVQSNDYQLEEHDEDLEEIKSSKRIKLDIDALNNRYNYYKSDDSYFKHIEQNKRTLKSVYLIVEYTKVFSEPKFCNFTSEKIFNSEREQCAYSNCKYTCDKSKDIIKDADALIFHQRDLESEFRYKYKFDYDKWLANTEQLPFKTVNDKLNNNPNQIWILWNDESTRIDKNFNKLSNLFNWTLSFKTNAEIYEGSYGYFLNRFNQTHLITSNDYYNIKKQIYLNDFKFRKNSILWFVSNCKSKYRLYIALEISKYYPLYIYGNCNVLDDLINSKSLPNYKLEYPYLNYVPLKGSNCKRGSNCELDKLKSFKYYLAFENINCKDYVSEKLWKSLNNNLIPILLQPNKDSYLRYKIPDESIIHLNDDFNNNVKLLVDHLHKIDSSFELYFKYLKWTNLYLQTIDSSLYLEPHRMCQLCTRLNTLKSNIVYKNIADFFFQDCQV